MEIVPGTIESGWQANLIISNQNNEVIRDTRGWFSEAIALQQAYNQWENNYFSWGTGNRWLRRRPVPPDILITNYATIDDCQNSALELVEELNKWLKNSTLEDIKLALIKYANPEFVSVKLVIRTDDPFLQKLPWHRSHFFRTNYLHHNISFTMSRGCKICKLKSPVKILLKKGICFQP